MYGVTYLTSNYSASPRTTFQIKWAWMFWQKIFKKYVLFKSHPWQYQSLIPSINTCFIEILFKICDSSKHLYAFCAEIDEHTLWCVEQIENHKAEDFALYLNSADWGKIYEIECFVDYEMIPQDHIERYNDGKRGAIGVDSCGKKG